VIARFDELFERRYPSTTSESAALVDRICSSSRAENRAAAAQLTAIGDLFAYRLSRCSDTELWAVDTVEAVSAELAAALRISQGLAGSRLRYARAMRERLPKVADMFKAGDIDYRMFQTIVYRTDLITDREVLAAVDVELAVKVTRWPSMTQGRLAGQVDKIVATADADAVRRRKQRQADREIWIGDLEGGMSEIHGSLFTPDGHALEKRLNALAATVCEHDPRSREQRRADALRALAAAADRLGCRCGRPDCAAGKRPAATPVVIHVIARASHPRRPRCGARIRGGRRWADRTGTRCGTGHLGETGGAGASGLCATGIGICAVGGAGGFCALPGFDLPLARLRPAGAGMRPRPYDPVRQGRANACVELEVLLPHAPARPKYLDELPQ
jgi:hypothetical protein